MDETAREKKKRLRSRIDFVGLLILTHDGKDIEYTNTHDISMNGVFAMTAKPLPIGTEGRFRFVLSAGMRQETIVGRYEVVRVVGLDDGFTKENPGPGMGLKFLDFEDDSSELLFNVIRYNNRE